MLIDNKTLLILVAIFIVLAILVVLTVMQLVNVDHIRSLEKLEVVKSENIRPEENRVIPDHALYQSPGILQNFNPTDPVLWYDYRKIYDPLTEPTRRVSRYELPPYHFKRMIDLPTRGYPDNFTQFGVLVFENNKGKHSDDNIILRLFGRQEFPGSNRYEYYTGINTGSDQVKIPINNKRGNELYDGDEVFVEELGRVYRVKLHKYDAPKYYPDLFY